jgi:hypothetical protein
MKYRTTILSVIITCITAVSAQAQYLRMMQQYGYIQSRPPVISPAVTVQHVGVRPINATVTPRQTVQPIVPSPSLSPVAQFKSQPPQLKQYQDGMNLYQYCKSDPVNYVDPWGLTSIKQYKNPTGYHHAGILVDGQDVDFGPNYPNIVDGMSPWPFGGPDTDAEITELTKRNWGLLLVGTFPPKRCKCATYADIKKCINAMSAIYDWKPYIYPIQNCQTFVWDVRQSCCLEKKK